MSLDYSLYSYALCIASDRIVVSGVLSQWQSREGFLQVVKFALFPISSRLCYVCYPETYRAVHKIS